MAGINFERPAHGPFRPGFVTRLIAIVLTLLGILIVVWLLFNPIRPRPTTAAYVQSFNRIAAAQSLPERLDNTRADPGAGGSTYSLGQTGLQLRLSFDGSGYISALSLADDPAADPQAGWQQLTPVQLRNRILLTLDALDAKWTMVALYRTFGAMSLDLDQPLAAQPAGTREQFVSGLRLRLTHDSQHFSLEATLDVVKE